MSDGSIAPRTSGDSGGDREAAARAAEQGLGAARQAVSSATGQAREAVDRQKSAGADQIEDVAGAVHRAADELRERMPDAAGYVDEAAAGLERVSSSLRGSSLGEIAGSVEDFARRQPAAYFGATVLAGFALSRFLKSSAPAGRSPTGRHDGAASM